MVFEKFNLYIYFSISKKNLYTFSKYTLNTFQIHGDIAEKSFKMSK